MKIKSSVSLSSVLCTRVHGKGMKVYKYSCYNAQKWFGNIDFSLPILQPNTQFIEASHIELFSIWYEFFFIYTVYN